MSKHEQIGEEKNDKVNAEPSNDLDVPEKKSEEVKGGVRVKPVERDPTVAGQ